MWILFISIIFILISLIFSKIQDNKLITSVTQIQRGTRSERKFILKLLKSGFPSDIIFHDLYIDKKDGSYSQIDIVLITHVGVIVVEVKDFTGWIFGFGHNEKWVQVLGKMKYPFYNPIFQNDGHINSLKNKILGDIDIPFYSLIVFYGDCELKKLSNIPDGTIIIKSNRIVETINSILKNQNITYIFDKTNLLDILNNGVANGGKREIQLQHVENLKKYSMAAK